MGQSFLDLSPAYKTQAVQLMVVIIGKMMEPLFPSRLRITWSIYEKYMVIAIADANQPIPLIIFPFFSIIVFIVSPNARGHPFDKALATLLLGTVAK